MIVDFNEIPTWSKLWVFPSSRKFYEQEISGLKENIAPPGSIVPV